MDDISVSLFAENWADQVVQQLRQFADDARRLDAAHAAQLAYEARRLIEYVRRLDARLQGDDAPEIPLNAKWVLRDAVDATYSVEAALRGLPKSEETYE